MGRVKSRTLTQGAQHNPNNWGGEHFSHSRSTHHSLKTSLSERRFQFSLHIHPFWVLNCLPRHFAKKINQKDLAWILPPLWLVAFSHSIAMLHFLNEMPHWITIVISITKWTTFMQGYMSHFVLLQTLHNQEVKKGGKCNQLVKGVNINKSAGGRELIFNYFLLLFSFPKKKT